MIQPVEKEKESIQILGITVRTSNSNEMTENAQIPQLWETFYQQQVFERVSNLAKSPITYALYSDYDDGLNGEYSTTVGLEVKSEEIAPKGLIAKEIPAAKYLIFTSEKGPITEIVIKTWQNIWRWFEQSDVERAYTGDFEIYDERCSEQNEAQVDIYVAIKELNAK